MLIVISPAKTLDYESPVSFKKSTSAYFHNYSNKLIEVLKKQCPAHTEEIALRGGGGHAN